MDNNELLKVDFRALAGEDAEVECMIQGAECGAEALAAADVQGLDIAVKYRIHRVTEWVFDLKIHLEGTVQVPCDRCLDPVELPIEGDDRLTVKVVGSRERGAGDSPAHDETTLDDDTISIDEEIPILDLAWRVYEFIALNIPIKHVHAPGKCNRVMTDAIEAHSAARSSDEGGEAAIDPRWSKLEALVRPSGEANG